MDAAGLAIGAVQVIVAIKESLEKVGRNTKDSKHLIDGVLKDLDDLKTLCNDDFAHAPHLRKAYESLTTNLGDVHRRCQDLAPDQKGRGKLKAKLTAWRKRNDIEEELVGLREQVAGCLAKFTAFSTGRTENTVARTEHALIRNENARLVDSAEVRFRFSHLDLLVGKMILESPSWGERVTNPIEINMSCEMAIERQYLRVQACGLANSMEAFTVARPPLNPELPNSNHPNPLIPMFPTPWYNLSVVIEEILSLRRSIGDATSTLSTQDTARRLHILAFSFDSLAGFAGDFFDAWDPLDLLREAKMARQAASHIYHSLSRHHHDFLPYMVNSDLDAVRNDFGFQPALAIPVIQRAIAALDLYEAQSDGDARILRARALCIEGEVFLKGKDFEGASQSFSTSLKIYIDVIHGIPLSFPNASLMAVSQLAGIFTHSSKACCGYVECMVRTDHTREAVSTVMQGLSLYQYLPSWVYIYDFDEKFGQDNMRKSLTDTLIKLYVDGQLSIAFLHDVVEQLLPLAVLCSRLLTDTMWDISVLYATLSTTHSVVPCHDIISIPVSPTFTLGEAYYTLPNQLPSRLVELLSSVDIDILLDKYFTHLPHIYAALLLACIITAESMKKYVREITKSEFSELLSSISYFVHLYYIPEKHWFSISEVATMLFERIPREERNSQDSKYCANILLHLGMYESALDVIGEYVNTPDVSFDTLNVYLRSVRIISLVKLGRTLDVIPFAQSFIVEFWSYILSRDAPQGAEPSPWASTWASVCRSPWGRPEIMTAVKMSWMVSAGYYEDVPGVEIYQAVVWFQFVAFQCVIDDLHEFALAQGSRWKCIPLIPCELWETFRSKFRDIDPATLLVGSHLQMVDPPTPPGPHLLLESAPTDGTPSPNAPSPAAHIEVKDLFSAHLGTDGTCAPPPPPTNSPPASSVAHPDGIHATKIGDLPTTGAWYKRTLAIHLTFDIAAVLIGIALYLAAGRGMSLNFNLSFH